MHNVGSIGFLVGALAVATLPARADDQVIGFATGLLGGSARSVADSRQAEAVFGQRSAIQRSASLPRVSIEAYAGFAQSGGLARACSHVGGLKTGSWTCR